ncbi:MAG: class I SAM-dependent methyltransferase [Pseudomonadota bacterium]
MMVGLSENTMHAYSERGNDLNQTPDCATEALIKAEQLPDKIWEPACGPGAIARVLKRYGHTVFCSDLIDYGYDDALGGRDFLFEFDPPDVDAIVTNPPFKMANDFVRHAIRLVPRVYMLLRLSYLEGVRRSDILDSGQLARVYVFRDRLPMMHREGYEGPKVEKSRVPFAWFVWDNDYAGPTFVHRISADAPEVKRHRKSKPKCVKQIDFKDMLLREVV